MKRISKKDAESKMAAIAGLISSMDSLDIDKMKGYKDDKKILEAKKAKGEDEEDED